MKSVKITPQICALVLGVSYIMLGIKDFFDYVMSTDILANPYTYLVALTLLLGVVLLIKNKMSAEHIVFLVIIVEMIIESGYILQDFYGGDDLTLIFNYMTLVLFIATLFFLFMYAVGYRHNAQRMIGAFLAMCILQLLEPVISFFYVKDILFLLDVYWGLIFQLLVYGILILLLSDIRFSDPLPMKRVSINSSAMFRSMDGGITAYISREDYESLTENSEEGWHPSNDPDVELERTIDVMHSRGKYDLVLQRRHGSDTVHAILHMTTSGSIFHALIFDIVHIESMGTYCGSKKIRIFGYDGMFVDLLVGKPDMFLVMPEYP